jgi:hypothetical protein
MNFPRRLAAVTAWLGAAALAASFLAGCGSHAAASPSAISPSAGSPSAASSGSQPAATGSASQPAATPAGPARQHAGWPERTVVRENQRELISNQVVDPQAAALYALVAARLAPERGPYLLRRTDLATGAVRTGPEFAGGSIALAQGYLWIFAGLGQRGSRSAPLVIREVSPKTLTVVRSVSFPPPGLVPYVSVAAGPGVSVWIGEAGHAWLISAVTGMVVSKVTVPAGFGIVDIAVDPAGRHLYVSVRSTSPEGGPDAVFEYDAVTGRLLASAEHGPVTFGLAGAELTATPPGVWASYRTGMLGATILLRQRGLVTVQPPDGGGPGPGSVYVWGMGATTVYGGGTLWLANEGGVLACSSPQSGAVRAKTRTRPGLLVSSELLAVNPAAHLVYGLGSGGLIAISPPARCWR